MKTNKLFTSQKHSIISPEASSSSGENKTWKNYDSTNQEGTHKSKTQTVRLIIL